MFLVVLSLNEQLIEPAGYGTDEAGVMTAVMLGTSIISTIFVGFLMKLGKYAIYILCYVHYVVSI